MDTLLMVSVVLITLAIMAQAGVLLGMYLLSRRVTDKVDTLMTDSRKLLAPLESITSNLKTVSNDLAETGKIAREQVLHIQEIVSETHDTIRGHIYEVREVVLDTMDEARDVVMRPIRQYSAIANAIAEGVRTFFAGSKKVETETEIQSELHGEGERQYPAA